MNINIRTSGIELTEAIRTYIDKKIGALEKHLGTDAANTTVEIGKSANHHKPGDLVYAEVRIMGDGVNLFAKQESHDLYKAIDLVEDEMKRELDKKRGKELDLSRKGGRTMKDVLKGFPWVGKKKI